MSVKETVPQTPKWDGLMYKYEYKWISSWFGIIIMGTLHTMFAYAQKGHIYERMEFNIHASVSRVCKRHWMTRKWCRKCHKTKALTEWKRHLLVSQIIKSVSEMGFTPAWTLDIWHSGDTMNFEVSTTITIKSAKQKWKWQMQSRSTLWCVTPTCLHTNTQCTSQCSDAYYAKWHYRNRFRFPFPFAHLDIILNVATWDDWPVSFAVRLFIANAANLLRTSTQFIIILQSVEHCSNWNSFELDTENPEKSLIGAV